MQNPEMLPCSRLRRVVLALGAGLLLSVFSAGSARADSDECAYFNPFMALCCKGTAEQVREAARQGAQVNMRIESEEGGRGALTPLIAAAGNNNRPVVRALLDAGADLNASLMEAAQNGSVPETRQMRLLQVLLAEGPNVNGRDDLGNTPLLVAALPMTVKMLLAAGADVNVRNKAGETPLMRAATHMDKGTIQALLEAGAEVDAKDNDGRTALMKAASFNARAGVVASLLLAGADKSLKDAESRDALQHARLRSTHVGPGDGDDENDPDVVAALKKARAAAEAEKAEIIRLLEGGSADAKEPVLVEVRHAEVKGKTRVTLKAKVPLTLLFRELEEDGSRKPSQVIKSSVRLAAGETHSFIHEQPFDLPTQAAVCAKPKSGAEMCWLHRDNEADEGGRFIMEPGFVLKN